MKFLKVSLLFTILFVLSCNKNDGEKSQTAQLIGKWKIDKKIMKWGNDNPEEQYIESLWIEFAANGEFREQHAGGGTPLNISRWSILSDGNLNITSSTDIPTSSEGLVIKSATQDKLHLYLKGLFGSFYTEVEYNIYLSRL